MDGNVLLIWRTPSKPVRRKLPNKTDRVLVFHLTSHRKSHSQQPNAPCDSRVCPTARIVRQSFKDKVSCAAFSQNDQGYHRHEEEDDVTNSSNELKCVQQRLKPEIEHEGNHNQYPHDHGCVPPLRVVVWVIEDRESSNHVGKNGWRATTNKYPRKDSYPSCRALVEKA